MEIKKVLEKAREEGLALTFDDLRLRTDYSEVLPDEVDVSSKFSRNVGSKIPIIGAAMDTVTEYALAIELAKLGGIGVIHKNLDIGEQAAQVARVKYHLNGLIDNPICVFEDETVSAILSRREEKEYRFHSFPVLDRDRKLVGIITENDFDLCTHPDLKAKQIMTSSLLTAKVGTTLDEAYDLMRNEKKKALPLVDDQRVLQGMYVFSDVKRIKERSAVMYNVDKRGQLIVAAAVGTGEEALERVARLHENKVDVIVIDTAHGDSKRVYETLKQIKRAYNLDVVVGNVSVGASAKRLVAAGADGVKVGQGGGSICTTRIIAGIGRPQVSAIYDCAMEIDGSGVPICADGGLRSSGDITIAIGAGAHSVMMGSMLAGTAEAPGKIISVDGGQWKTYRGMGSLGAMQERKGSRERYNQGNKKGNKLVPEGVEGAVPYKGSLADVMIQYMGGLRSGMGYVGAASIEELRKRGDFDRITSAGFKESHPHDIKITRDSPNYRRED